MSWRRFFQRARWDRERSSELVSHLEIEIDENIARGMRPDEARAAAYRKLGNPTLVREEIYGMNSIGLRYFNVFGPRQDPDGAYAAVIPRWIAQLIRSEPVYINGDGETSRDFCYIENVVQANLLAATTENATARNHQIYNIAVSACTTLNTLFELERELLAAHFPRVRECRPHYRDFRQGDVRHSQADISKARRILGYAPTHSVERGLKEAMGWYVSSLS